MAKQYKRIPNPELYTQYGDVLVKTHILTSKQEPQPTGCIHWTGPRHRQGYGMIGGIRMPGMTGIMMTVHRLMMKITLNRALSRTEEVIHTCGNMQCVNPDHLILGDAKTRAAVTTANNPGLRTRHRTTAPKKQNRQYRYSESEIQWIRTADPAYIAVQYKIGINRARTMQWSMRKYYRWLK